MQLVLAEKPSVARDLARVLGVRTARPGCLEGPDHIITWCVGHLVELDEPASYDARWKAWRLDTLPMLPAHFKLRPVPSSQDQLVHVRRLLSDRRVREVVNACDAGREGELIFRYVYELTGCRLPVRRLWISSLTDDAIRAGFAALRAGADYDPLADAARCRSEADWLVGLNATRAVTVRHRTGGDSPLFSIGRVQTPTLALVAARDAAIAAFVPVSYWEVRGTFSVTGDETGAPARFEALWTHEAPDGTDPKKLRPLTRLASAALADELIARDEPAPAVVQTVRGRRTREPAPLLFDLTSLQRTANRRYGLSAARTLEIAQALYETHKLLTYPRTDARYLSRDLVGSLPKLFAGLAALDEYRSFAERLRRDLDDTKASARFAGNRRVFDDAKVHDHHAIIPTLGKINEGTLAGLSRDERRLYDLVVRRFLAAFCPDAEFAATEIVVKVGEGNAGGGGMASGSMASSEKLPGAASHEIEREEPRLDRLPPPPDRFVARGRVRLEAGWQEVAGIGAEAGADEQPTLPKLEEGARLTGIYKSAAKQTRPPPPLTEATLLAAMETAGRTIEDEELRAAMKDSGLGTPATRAATIETLIKRGFVVRAGKNLNVTETGKALLAALPVTSLASSELTGRWEARLSRIARGLEGRAAFMQDIAKYVAEVVQAIKSAPVRPLPPSALRSSPSPRPAGDRNERDGTRNAAAGAGAPSGTGSYARETSAPVRAGKGGGGPARSRKPGAPRAVKASTAPKPARENVSAATDAAPLGCPRCRQGTLLTGKRGWGCSRWKEGCGFVVWFDLEGKRLTDSLLRDLVRKGKTRKTRWPRAGVEVAGHLVLDVAAPATHGAVRFEPAPPKT
ncbi:MAG TPA: DNA topoisomerase [Polyangia bacterium]